MSSSDEERIRNILEVQAEGTSKRYHEFATRHVYDLAAWAKKAKRSSTVSYYPQHSSSEDYEKVMTRLMTARHENVRLAQPSKTHLLPWDPSIDLDFTWTPTSTVYDWARFTSKYPCMDEVAMTPTSYQEYEFMKASANTDLSRRSSPSILDRPSFYTESPQSPLPLYGINPDRLDTPPNNCDKRINFDNSDTGNEHYNPSARCDQGVYFDVLDKNSARKFQNEEALPRDPQFYYTNLSATESSSLNSSHEGKEEQLERRRRQRMRRLDYSSGTTDPDSSTTPEKLMKSIEEITLDDSDEKPSLKAEVNATPKEGDPTNMETDPPKEEAQEDKRGTIEDKEDAMVVDKTETQEDPKSILDQKREEHHALLRQTDEYIDDIKREKLLQESVLTEDEIDRVLANNSDDDEELEIKGYEIGLTLKTENLDKLRNDVMCHIFDLEEKVGKWAKPGQDVTKRPNYADNMRKLQQLNARFKGLERVNAEHKETLKLVKAAQTETKTITPPSSRSYP